MAETTIDTVRVAKRERWGFVCGATMALGASLSFAAARAGILGCAAADETGGGGLGDLLSAKTYAEIVAWSKVVCR